MSMFVNAARLIALAVMLQLMIGAVWSVATWTERRQRPAVCGRFHG